jgi:hypothetical protein
MKLTSHVWLAKKLRIYGCLLLRPLRLPEYVLGAGYLYLCAMRAVDYRSTWLRPPQGYDARVLQTEWHLIIACVAEQILPYWPGISFVCDMSGWVCAETTVETHFAHECVESCSSEEEPGKCLYEYRFCVWWWYPDTGSFALAWKCGDTVNCAYNEIARDLWTGWRLTF